VRHGNVRSYRGTAVFAGGTPTREIWDSNRVSSRFFAGAEAEARRLGYELQLVLPRAENLSPKRFAGMIKARGIVGALLAEHSAGDTEGKNAQDHPLFDSAEFGVVLVGHKQVRPSISFAMIDQYANSRLTGLILRERGYKKPLLVLTGYLQSLSEGRFEAGLGSVWRGVPVAVLPSYDPPAHPTEEDRQSQETLRGAFLKQVAEHRPDVVVSIDHRVPGWLREGGWHFPKKIGYVTLDWRPEEPAFAGIDQCHETVGALAMRELSEQIERNEKGRLAIVTGRLAEGAWREGGSLRVR
jgi:LacI family transcriptional regulator